MSRWRPLIWLALFFSFVVFSRYDTLAAQSVTLVWSPSVDTNVVGYNVYYGTASRVYTSKVDAGSTTNLTINGLAEGVKYFFAATAYNIIGMESDYSAEVSYVIPSLPGNQPPTLNSIVNVSVSEDAGPQTIGLSGISSGSVNENQSLVVSATSSNPSLIPNPTVSYVSPNTTGSLTFAPVAHLSGSATITVKVSDGGVSNNVVSRTFVVTVNPVNDVPTLSAIGNLVLNEDSGPKSVTLSGISSGAANEAQSLTVTASSSNPALIPNPTVTYTSPSATGTITFTPVANGFGSATITVIVNDGGASNNSVYRTFVVTVSPANDVPTLNSIANVSLGYNAAQQTVSLAGIGSGAPNEQQTLTITASSSNTGLIPNPTVIYTTPNTTGTLSFTPVANASGTSTVTVRVNDGSASNNIVTRTFVVTVTSGNQPPTLNPLTDLIVSRNGGLQTVNLSGITSGTTSESQTLTVTASSSNPGVIPDPAVTYSSPASTGKLTFTPVFLATGSAVVTVTVNDGGVSNNIISRSFKVTINAPPTISAIPSQTIGVNSNAGPISIVIDDLDSPLADLKLSAVSSAPALIPTNNITFGGSGGNRTIILAPLAGKTGVSTITVTVSDAVASASTTFQLDVLNAPSAPQILTIVTNGAGVVSGAKSGQTLVAGKTYTLTAIPAEGQVFAGWSGGVSSKASRITFRASSNMFVQANFVPNPYRAGSYSGLMFESDEVRLASSGIFKIVVSKNGAYSGRLQVGPSKYRVTGKLDIDCRATNTILRKVGGPLVLNLQLGTNDFADQIFGELTDGTWIAGLRGDRAVHGKTSLSPFAGYYTMVIPGDDSGPAPAGHGYGSVSVSPFGSLRFSGVLADGTKVTQSSVVSGNGSWPFYASLSKGQGAVVSWLTFTNRSNDDINGALSWIKSPGIISRLNTNGFNAETDVVGSKFTASTTENVLMAPSAGVTFEGGNLPFEFENAIQIALNNKVSNLSSNPLSLVFTPSKGMFKGKVTVPGTTTSYSFSGVVLQKSGEGCGFLIGSSLSSAVEIKP